MGVSLYPHQRKAVDKLRTGSILMGGVGTGKSRAALAYYSEKVCGVDLNHVEEFFASEQVHKKLYIITTARKRDTLEWDEECSHFLICRPWVTIDSWNNIKKYKDVKGAFFIFDEQRVVGSGAWVKSFLTIAKSNQWILLSATPGDTWLDYIPVFIANGFYKNRTEFIGEHVVYHRYTKFPKVERYVNTKKLEVLRSQIVIPMEFQKKTTQHHEWLTVGYDEELYNHICENRWDPFKQQPIKNVAELCYLLRKVVNADHKRLKAIADILEVHPRAIVFYNFDYELEALKSFAEAARIPHTEWNGHKHQPLLECDKWLYFVQYAAGAEGWNCITTDTTVFFSQNYSYRSTIQASGRIDRLNTPFTDLYYYHFCSNSNIDKAIKSCLNKKKDFNEKTFASEFIFTEGEASITNPETGEQLTLFDLDDDSSVFA